MRRGPVWCNRLGVAEEEPSRGAWWRASGAAANHHRHPRSGGVALPPPRASRAMPGARTAGRRASRGCGLRRPRAVKRRVRPRPSLSPCSNLRLSPLADRPCECCTVPGTDPPRAARGASPVAGAGVRRNEGMAGQDRSRDPACGTVSSPWDFLGVLRTSQATLDPFAYVQGSSSPTR